MRQELKANIDSLADVYQQNHAGCSREEAKARVSLDAISLTQAEFLGTTEEKNALASDLIKYRHEISGNPVVQEVANLLRKPDVKHIVRKG